MSCKTLHEVKQMSLLHKRNSVFRTHSQHQGYLTITFENRSHPDMHPPKTPKQACAFPGLVGYYRKFIKNFAKIAKPSTLLTCQQVKFDWTPTHHGAFLKLKESIIQAPVPCNTLILTRGTLFIPMHQMMPVEHSYPRNTMVWNFLLFFFHIHFKKHIENGAQLNQKLMESIMPLPNGIISREQIL